MARHIGIQFFVACAVVAISAAAVACDGATNPNVPEPVVPAVLT